MLSILQMPFHYSLCHLPPLQCCPGHWVLKDSPVGRILPPAHSSMGTRWRDMRCNSLFRGLCGGEKSKPISPRVPVRIHDSFLPVAFLLASGFLQGVKVKAFEHREGLLSVCVLCAPCHTPACPDQRMT